MNKIFLGLIVFFIGLFAFTSLAFAEPLNYDYEFITLDNGMQGLWATDYFKSVVTITPNGTEGCYNVVREDGGTFQVIDGAESPGGEDGTLVKDGTKGIISGGIEMIICGDLIESPVFESKPEDLTTGTYTSYADKYFHRFFSNITSQSFTDWGWTFNACNSGTWTDNNETETLYASIGVNDDMGDIAGKSNGWEDLGFKNLGQCMRFVESGKDSR